MKNLSTATKAGLIFILIALVGFLFGSQSIGGFCLGLGGLLLVFAGFKRFWKKLEDKYSE
ncbi:MAG: hypothetical protein MI867_19860 [Pseudomonadales bacterium]|nr:hypothetical protein [Pseudomonadales bacterium]